MLDRAADLTLAVHIVAGVVALLAGAGAILTRKGGPRHSTAGKSYVVTMAVVVLTAVPLAVRVRDWFLLAIAVFSGYLVFAGYRAVARRRAGLTGAHTLDLTGHATMLVVGGGMGVAGAWGTVSGTLSRGPVLVVFGVIGTGLAASMLARFRRPPADRSPWIEQHIAFMGAALIATVTAAVTVNLTVVPELVRWLGPTAVGAPLIAYAIQRYRPRFVRPDRSDT